MSLSSLRSQLSKLNLDAFIVPSGDAHQSEYVSDCDMRRQFISNFSGSAGTALVLLDKALLWTDGRYFNQASKELSSEWTLMKSGEPNVLEINDWIVKNMFENQSVGIDPKLFSVSQYRSLQKLFSTSGIKLICVKENPVDVIWTNRPAIPMEPVRVLSIETTGMIHTDKIKNLQSILKYKKSVGLVVTMLDEIAWLYNIRGGDIAYNPVVICYAVVTKASAYLFIDEGKVTPELQSHFLETVVIKPYEHVLPFLQELSSSADDARILIDPSQSNYYIYQSLGKSAYDITSPITLPKALKNESELLGIRECHKRDGAALTAFIHWLEMTVKQNPLTITEYDATLKLEEFRGKLDKHVGPSFNTIAGYAGNGAVIHYKPDENKSALIGIDSLFLLDSGGQYLDGTTDVTRTMHFGTPSARMKECYTLVLKGHISLAKMVFPEGTLGSKLDTIARMALWQEGLDYNHGTGHGVGAFLNVHEGPQGIGSRKRDNEVGFFSGMTISNEPGYYADEEFGIRIENICITIPKHTKNNFNGKQYLGFETVTMTPIKTDLIDLQICSQSDIDWINSYHQQVRESVLPIMEKVFPESVNYLLEQTEPIIV
eukprot:gene16905-23198_t